MSPDSPLFPGDRPCTPEWTATIVPDCPVDLGAITTFPHIGAHADSLLHHAAAVDSSGEL